jgi:hypothetical protein
MGDQRPGEEPELEEEGLPDLEGPLPSKLRTGDHQEGIIPPDDDWVAADEFGTTAAEQVRGEPLTARLREEQAEPPPLDERDDPGQLTQAGDTEPDGEPAWSPTKRSRTCPASPRRKTPCAPSRRARCRERSTPPRTGTSRRARR